MDFLGLDIGSTTAKAVLVRGGKVIYQKYDRHFSRVREKARELVERTVLTQADQRLLPKKDSKTSLQEYVHKDHKNTVIRYELLEESGPDHQKSFHMQVRIGGQVMGKGTGHSKQSAGQEAARAALEALKHS